MEQKLLFRESKGNWREEITGIEQLFHNFVFFFNVTVDILDCMSEKTEKKGPVVLELKSHFLTSWFNTFFPHQN